MNTESKANAAARASVRSLKAEDFFQVAYSMWAGKFIGGSLGAPLEGFKRPFEGDFDAIIPDVVIENDDTDIQVLWVHAMQEHGVKLDSDILMREWMEHFDAPWGEYGIAMANWQNGIRPPESGRVDNWFWGDGMGCPIRSEIWGIVAPGSPEVAADLAYMDGCLDHTENSIEAERFLAAMEAEVFFEKNLARLIECGQSILKPDTRFARMVQDVVAWCEALSWEEAYRELLLNYRHPDMTHVLQNMGITLISLLKGDLDFTRTMEIAILCGYDTDCTAATAGAIVAAIVGHENLPDKWRHMLSDEYSLSDCMLGFPAKGSLSDLAWECCRLAGMVSGAYNTGVRIEGAESVEPRIIPVEAQEARPVAVNERPFAEYVVYGPYWEDCSDRVIQEKEYPDHGNPNLPSAYYLSHMQSGKDTDFIDPVALATVNPAQLGEAPRRSVFKPMDRRIILSNRRDATGPASWYALTEFEVKSARKVWLQVGSTCPFHLFLDGKEVLCAEDHQNLHPNSFAQQAVLEPGRHRLVFKFSSERGDVEASLMIKYHREQHWHQCFIDPEIIWQEAELPG